jgi:general secretion pathway protein J
MLWRQRGFTLVELLVAMAILAMIAALGYRGLNAILDAEVRVQEQTRRWNDVGQFLEHFGQDLAFAIARPVRDAGGGVRPALVLFGSPGELREQPEGQLALTRLGHREAGNKQGDLQRVGYRLRNGTLEYLVWASADAAPGASASVSPVLEHVAALQFRALDRNGTWSALWPAGLSDSLPRAVEARIRLESGEQVTRLVALP